MGAGGGVSGSGASGSTWSVSGRGDGFEEYFLSACPQRVVVLVVSFWGWRVGGVVLVL